MSHTAGPPDFAAYVAVQRPALRRTAYLLTGDWDRAEDIVQDALASLFVHWRRAQRAGSIDAYCRRAIVNAFLSEGRRPWRRERTAADLPERSLPDPTDASDARDALRRALAELGPGQRAVIVLRYWEDLSVEETAQVLRTSPGNVKSQSARGLARLRDVLTQMEVHHDPVEG
jgi:RNA polymerase sigma-70 factor (sigma-E family)